MTAEVWLQVLAAVGTAAGAIWAVWAKLIPRLVEARLESMRRDGELVVNRAAHDLEMEQTYVGNLVQASVASQSDLINTNNRLINHLIESAQREMMELRKEIQMVRGIAIRDEGQFALTNMEISRLVDSMHRLEVSMESVKELLATIIRHQPVMRDPDEEELEL